jgi:hypothetical protein
MPQKDNMTSSTSTAIIKSELERRGPAVHETDRRRRSASWTWQGPQASSSQFRPLEGRSTWKSRLQPMDAPFYAIYNVGDYTFARYKVVWAEMSGGIGAAVVSNQRLLNRIGSKPVVPDHKIYFVAADSEDAAHFLCGMLNSEPVSLFVDSFTVKIQVGTICRHLKLPAYDPNNTHHRSLVELSKQSHELGINDERQQAINVEAWAVVESM